VFFSANFVQSIFLSIRFEVLTVVTMKSTSFSDAMPYILVVCPDISEEHTASFLRIKEK
jgi:hypothetical protein